MSQVILPKILSQLIRLALKDLEEAEKAPNVVIDMTSWHGPRKEGVWVCAVCLAGAVMRQTLGADDAQLVDPEDFPENALALRALDWLRSGCVETALEELDIPNRPIQFRDIARYEQNPVRFKSDLLKLADDLEKEGL